MNKNDFDVNLQVNPIGKEVAIFRALLNMTQQEFADTIYSTRITINKVENSKSNISIDMGFRLYYITQKLKENPFADSFLKEKATYLQSRVENEILLSHKLS